MFLEASVAGKPPERRMRFQRNPCIKSESANIAGRMTRQQLDLCQQSQAKEVRRPILRLKRQTRPFFKINKFGETEHPPEDYRPIAEILATVGDRRTAPILAALFAATFPCRGGPDDLARFFRRSLFSPLQFLSR
jgi:hypothetical protein